MHQIIISGRDIVWPKHLHVEDGIVALAKDDGDFRYDCWGADIGYVVCNRKMGGFYFLMTSGAMVDTAEFPSKSNDPHDSEDDILRRMLVKHADRFAFFLVRIM